MMIGKVNWFERISLPYLFLALLKHFLSVLSYDGSDYSPQEYLKVLYTNSDTNHPLKLYDPLNTIKDFCDTLQTLWRHGEKANLNEFKIFKFNGQGLLQGKQSTSESNWTRILAYCGNKWIEGKGKCVLCDNLAAVILLRVERSWLPLKYIDPVFSHATVEIL